MNWHFCSQVCWKIPNLTYLARWNARWQPLFIIIIIIIINEKNLTWRLVPRNCKDTEHTLIDDVFSTVQYSTSRRQKLRHQYDMANKYVFKCLLNVDTYC